MAYADAVVDDLVQAKARADRAAQWATRWKMAALHHREVSVIRFKRKQRGEARVSDLEQAVAVLVGAVVTEQRSVKRCALCGHLSMADTGVPTGWHNPDCQMLNPAIRRVLGEEENDATSNAR